MRPHSSNMISVTVKTEKADLEASTARNRLDAVLQCLVEKSDIERDHADDEIVKPVLSDLQSKDSSPAAAGKRPSTRFPHQRRKKRKETEDAAYEGVHQRPNAYTMKLFDRSVDLAQFNENTPLYPICRSWMRNKPSLREGTRSPTPQPPVALEDEEVAEVMNGKGQDIYKLPVPTPCSLINLRVPSPLPPTEKHLDISMSRSNVPGVPTLLYNHMDRWKKIRQRWREASHRNQYRYRDSMKILKEMFERQ
ncbi:protein lin-37 homolog isoform X1 [Hemiscyllium ocellatum]|uniref:protein lin-37 homolog isoform X1 n=1 Tax=Hemiscyllium ocellatum TaxID=170820 RepID=UPI00296618C5|nr:protein lin-37 homolog isoform X1 [Hemiscyllium ocellatum]XP_060678226.1 protein lin-37 homolog isoform X1 [Hemiscyllium ocellatum]XP_060679423.1 protein lin-37 homolog isoform X1 [Hemiscyllium ocellatum]XP_060679424.1 protein lin-37 homolog isoform X1 [Hemiscyllium ocellatum]